MSIDWNRMLPREEARDELLELCRIVEVTHPDPFVNCGGRVAFYHSVHDEMNGWGSELSLREFWRSCAAVMARLQDMHSTIYNPPLGARLPVDCMVVGDGLVVSLHEAPSERLRLEAVQGVPLQALRTRAVRLRGCDNESHEWSHTAWALCHPLYLELMGVLASSDSEVVWDCCDAQGNSRRLVFDTQGTPAKATTGLLSGPEIPMLNEAGMGWHFLDSEGKRALLAIDNCYKFREHFLMLRELLGTPDDALRRELKGLASEALPLEEAIAQLPSAVTLFLELFAAMKEKSTQVLLVDLRRNGGGNSVLGSFLRVFLGGRSSMLRTLRTHQVMRDSTLLKERYPALAKNCSHAGGYSFADLDLASDEARWREAVEKEWGEGECLEALQRWHPQVDWKREEPLWAPQVFVLTSAETASAAFDVMTSLWSLGAKVAGVAPAQAANCYIDLLPFTLPRSGLRGHVSFKLSRSFPDGHPRSKLFEPDIPLTPEEFLSQGWNGILSRCG